MAKTSLIWQKLNLSQATGLFAALLILLTGLIISLLTYQQQLQQVQADVQQQTQQQLQRLAQTLAPSLLNEDRISLNLTLNEWYNNQLIKAVRILNTDQQVLAETGHFGDDEQLRSQAITQDNLAVGMLQASINPAGMTQPSRRALAINLLASALLSFLGALLAYQLTERVLLYPRQLTEQLQQWQHGNALDIKQPDISDLLPLHQTLSEIAEREEQRRAVEKALAQFINSDCNKPLNHFGYHPCALLYIEIQELKVLQTRLSANELSELLNQYYKLLNQAAKLYNGKLDRFQGDGIVMLFGLPNPDQQDALHCLYAAQLFSGLIDHIGEQNNTLLPLKFRIAAHFGSVLLAPIGDDQQLQGNLIGDTLHWAAQLAQQGENHRLLASQAIVDRIDEEELGWNDGPAITDFYGNDAPSYWLSQLPEKNQSLIARQIKHIIAMTEQA